MKNFESYFSNIFLAEIEFEAYDNEGNEVLDDELYTEVEVDANNETEATEKIWNMDFSTTEHPKGKSISYINFLKK